MAHTGFQEFYDLTTIQEAAGRLGPLLPAQLQTEAVSLAEACGRVLAAPVLADADLPGFCRSTVDGYAVRARDTFGSSESQPAFFTTGEPVTMGAVPTRTLVTGVAAPIATGAMLPPGADAVVMVEHTSEAGAALEVYRPVGVGENVIQASEDLAQGQMLFAAGHRLRPADLGGLAAVGATEVTVFRRPRVAIISTGDELVDALDKPGPGQVRDINSWTLWGLVQSAGAVPRIAGIIRDDLGALKAAVKAAAAESDLLILSGGSSVGARDHAMAALADLGAPGVLVHGLAIRPGKPTIIGAAGNLPYFGLPGHPVACAVVFEVVVRPVLRQLQGLPGLEETHQVPARVTRNLPSAPGREDFIRVRLTQRDDSVWAEPLLGKSGIISTVARADGLIRIPFESDGLYEGETVTVQLFE